MNPLVFRGNIYGPEATSWPKTSKTLASLRMSSITEGGIIKKSTEARAKVAIVAVAMVVASSVWV